MSEQPKQAMSLAEMIMKHEKALLELGPLISLILNALVHEGIIISEKHSSGKMMYRLKSDPHLVVKHKGDPTFGRKIT